MKKLAAECATPKSFRSANKSMKLIKEGTRVTVVQIRVGNDELNQNVVSGCFGHPARDNLTSAECPSHWISLDFTQSKF